MKKFVIRLLVNAFAFFVAITLLSGRGIEPQGSLLAINLAANYLILALIFGIVNAILRPILTLVGCPVIILTLGLGVLLINTLLFYITGLAGTRFGVGFTVDGFVPAFLGALIISVIGLLLNGFLRDERKH